MFRHFAPPLLVLVVLLFGSVGVDVWQATALPRTVHDVMQVAGGRGLFCVRDGVEGGHNRLVISVRRLGAEDVLKYHLLSDLLDVVNCYLPGKEFECNYVPGRTLVWGAAVLVGDPDVIEKLTGRRP
jgi:hypothetical protein